LYAQISSRVKGKKVSQIGLDRGGYEREKLKKIHKETLSPFNGFFTESFACFEYVRNMIDSKIASRILWKILDIRSRGN